MQVSELWALRSMMPGFRPSVPPVLHLHWPSLPASLLTFAEKALDERRCLIYEQAAPKELVLLII